MTEEHCDEKKEPDMPPAYMDHRHTRLNPCSLESITTPLELPNGQQVWPLMLSCYQLDESTSQREGDLQLHLVYVPDLTGAAPTMPLELGEPYQVVRHNQSIAGVLDGSWCQLPDDHGPRWIFASAHANGTIQLRLLTLNEPDAEIPLDSDPQFTIHYAGESPPLEIPHHDAMASSIMSSSAASSQSSVGSTDVDPPLCLSLNWDSVRLNDDAATSVTLSRRMVSSYSNGYVALHDMIQLDSGGLQLVQTEAWLAHTYRVGSRLEPAEVWTAALVGHHTVWTGGDDAIIKLWDVRCPSRATRTLHPFNGGVTCIQPHPVFPHMIVCGSYDETIVLYDSRMLPTPLAHSKESGGGIWRLQWHPYTNDRLLAACMHGGCRVLKLSGFSDHVDEMTAQATMPSVYRTPSHVSSDSPSIRFRVKKEFVEHTSMAYGASWLCCRHPTQNGYFEAAASCSFYDRAVYLWDSVF